MKNKRFLVNRKFKLNGRDIAQCIGIIEDLPDEIFTEENGKLATCLLIEDALLKYQERFGEEKDFVLYIHRRFGKYYLRITVNGEDFDPLNGTENAAYTQAFSRLVSVYGSQLSYRYQFGNNQLAMSLGKRPKLSGVPLLIVAVLCGLLIGWATSLLPESLQVYPLSILEDIQSIILGLISFAALPVVFFSVIEGITACGSVQNLGQRGVKTIKSFFLVSFIVMVGTCIAGCFVFPQN